MYGVICMRYAHFSMRHTIEMMSLVEGKMIKWVDQAALLCHAVYIWPSFLGAGHLQIQLSMVQFI